MKSRAAPARNSQGKEHHPKLVAPLIRHRKTMINTLAKLLLSVVLSSPVLLYGYGQQQRPPRSETTQALFQGIDYQRQAIASPRPNVLHIVTIDLSTPGIQPIVTSPNLTPIQTTDAQIQASTPQKQPISAQTTREFVARSGVQLGINGNYFYEFREKTPWDFYPHSGEPVYAVGEAIGSGDRYGTPEDGWPALCFLSNTDTPPKTPSSYRAIISAEGECPSNTKHGLAGRDLLVEQGNPLSDFPNVSKDKPYSRVAVGIDKSGIKVWLVIVDGKQPLYSEGLRLDELADVFQDLGADEAIALDGGGSSTLVVNLGASPTTSPDNSTNHSTRSPRRTQTSILNTPMHVKWPHQERPTANHLGFYALPINP